MSNQAGTGSLDAAIEVTDALEPGAVLVLPGLRLHDETLDEYVRRCYKITGVGTEEGRDETS